MSTEHLVCQCNSPEHTLNFVYFNEEEELYGFIHLNHFPFWKRLWVGLKYILGMYSSHGHYEEFMMSSADLSKIEKTLKTISRK